MQKIVIIGTTGSGKTTLAREMASRLGVRAVDLDDLFWLPDWQSRNVEEFAAAADSALAGDKWVVSGNYTRLRPVIWPKADTLVWIDYPFLTVLGQLLARSISRARNKTAICNGNYETWKKLFSTDSIIWWFFKTYWKNARRYGELFARPQDWPNMTFIRLRSRRDTQEFLKGLKP